MCCSRRSTRWFFGADNTFVIQSGDFFWDDITFVIQSGDLFLGWHYIRDSKLCLLFWADIRFDVQRGDFLSHTRRSRWWQFLADIQRSTWWLYSQHSTFNIVLGTDITFDVQRGVCFWPTFDQLFRHLISTSWVLKAVIREHHTVFRHLTSTSRLWKAVFTTHQT